MPLNPFINDIRLLFPDEYEVALEGREVINKFISRMINDDEVGFITLHIHSAISSNQVAESMEATRINCFFLGAPFLFFVCLFCFAICSPSYLFF